MYLADGIAYGFVFSCFAHFHSPLLAVIKHHIGNAELVHRIDVAVRLFDFKEKPSVFQTIAELRNYDEVCKKRRVEMKNTSELIETILADGHISNVNLRMLVRQIKVHQNEDKSIDISFDMNGAFDYNIMEDVTDEIL